MANILGKEHLINQCIENHGDEKNSLRHIKKTQEQMTKISHQMGEHNSWESCYYCPLKHFDCVADFIKHLQERHCTREGGSYVCRYGCNGVCPSLPLDGVSDRDYDDHVLKYHVNQQTREMAPEWSVFSASQNLPAALNDPSRGKQSNLFTKRWGLDFVEKTHIPPSPYIPDITLMDFEKYSNKIGKRYRRHECLSMRQNLKDQNERNENEASHSTTNSNFNSFNANNPVPDIFFKETLNLQNPHIFAKVFPGIMQTQNGEQRRQTGRLLQEQLSHYLDVIEVKIAQQVSQKSPAFFHAMTSQDAITSEMEEAAKQVKCLRQHLSILHESVVTNAFRLLRYGKRRHNFEMVLDKLHLMATVHKTQPMLQLLLGTQDYVAALDLITTTQEVLTQELMGIHCFKHLPMQLNEMEKLIDKMLITEFERYATASLNRPLERPLANDINDIISKTFDVDMEDKLICILMGLLRKKNFTFIDIFKEESIVTLRTIIKQLIIEFFSTKDMEVCLTGVGGEEDAATIHLTINERIILLNKLTITLLYILKRIKIIIDIMKRITDVAAGSGIGIDHNINNFCNNNNTNTNKNNNNNNYNDNNDNSDNNSNSTNSDNVIRNNVNSSDKINMDSMDNSNNNSKMDLIDTDIVFLDANEKIYIYDKLNELLCNVCGYCLERCSNLISNHNQKQNHHHSHNHNHQHQNQSHHNNQHQHQNSAKDIPAMPPVVTADELTRLSQLVDAFTDGCIQIYDKMTSNPLKVAVQVQSARFAHKYHNERKQKLSLLLDGERWRQVDVPKTFQKMLDYVNVNGLISLPKLLCNEEFSTEVALNAATTENEKTQVNPILLIDSERYALVGSVLLLIQLICEYCCCAYNLPIVASYLSHNIIDLLRLYNARSCQLVMCGGALRVAGLKTITATNLALVCKALELILWLLPKVKEHFKQLDPTTLIGYDQLEKDFISHMMEIENKICNIVNDCISGQLNKWDARPPIPSTSFRNISRDLVKLKEAISCILSAEQIRNIYLIIHKNFKDKLREQLKKLNIINNGGPQHGAVTSELLFYMETMQTLDALPSDELNHSLLEKIWEQST